MLKRNLSSMAVSIAELIIGILLGSVKMGSRDWLPIYHFTDQAIAFSLRQIPLG